jgi:hypothetical protein
MLAKDTKNCPKCTTPIFKINGCDQMYCTQCHTAFSWTNGAIEKGVIHNPHYYEYQRRINNGVIPRVAGDDGCHVQRVVNIRSLYERIANYKYTRVETAHRMIGHIEAHIDNLYTLETLDLRVNYLDNKITEKQWLDTLKRRQKRHEKDAEVRQILRMVVDTFTDLFRMFVDKYDKHVNTTRQYLLRGDKETEVFVDELIDSLKTVCQYANESLAVVSKQYDNVVPYFDEDCYMHSSTEMYSSMLSPF